MSHIVVVVNKGTSPSTGDKEAPLQGFAPKNKGN